MKRSRIRERFSRTPAVIGQVGTRFDMTVRPVGQPLITIAPLDGGDEPAGHATYREEERAGSGNVPRRPSSIPSDAAFSRTCRSSASRSATGSWFV